MPVTAPAASERNLTPTSNGLSKPWSMVTGAAELGQMVTSGTVVTVMLNVLVVVCVGLLASLTLAVKLKVPVLVGVPVIAPLLVLSVRPGGSDPLVINQV